MSPKRWAIYIGIGTVIAAIAFIRMGLSVHSSLMWTVISPLLVCYAFVIGWAILKLTRRG